MSYQALLFCLDEKLARVVTQVFSDLDFTVEPVNEPFAAVKKLMAHRYDAVVVDCENEPNATLLFKSARNSASNQSSLALALVEGQAGVAKAYRIGANLVLTKPINVEQAKGTLRVARGLLRKNVESATPSTAAPAKVAPAPSTTPVRPAIQNVEISPARTYEVPELEAELPAMAASAEIKDSPVVAPIPEAITKVSAEVAPPAPSALPASLFEAATSTATISSASLKSPVASPAASTGAASAPAPAREISVPAEKKPIAVPVERAEVAVPAFENTGPGSSPTFGALDDQDSGGSGGSKKMMAIAAAVIVAAALGYFAWTKFSKTSSPAQSVSVPQTALPAPSPEPTSVKPSASTPEPAVSATQPAGASQSSKPSASVSTGVLGVSPESDVTTKKVAPPAIVVKSYTPGKSQAQTEESAPQVPNPMAMTSSNDKKLSGLVSAVPSALPAPSLSTVKISQGVSQGLLIKRVQPRYPQNALSMRIQGAVQLEATINKEGNISNLKVVSGDPVLVRAATEAVHQWRYKPYYLNGEPVEIETQITINFKLPN